MASTSSREVKRLYHTFLDFEVEERAETRIVVPQKVYNPHRPALAAPCTPVDFKTYGQLGFNLQSAYDKQQDGLEDAAQICHLTDGDKSVAIRIQWPGYGKLQSKMKLKNPTKLSIASTVAERVEAHIRKMKTTEPTEECRDWDINNFDLCDMYLLRLEHVSTGSWQPILSVG
ncbi:hypothetical protein BDW22DRAFT_1359483 [Trametopsis cervina]|nr:hypothetical protein BDW22DRAFT_1359483 [Trametopsis cervina]